MGQEFYGFDKVGAKRIVDAVREVENATAGFDHYNDDNDQLFQTQGKMIEALSAGKSFGENPPQALMQVYMPDEDQNNKLIDAGYTVVLTNRDPDITKEIDDWCRAVFLNGEWQPHGGGSGGCDFIQFTIQEVNRDPVSNDCISAIVRIDFIPCGCGSVPEDYNGTVVVYDEQCHFAGIAAQDLVGLQGSAKYMTTYDPGDCQWNIVHLCCPDDTC